MQGKKYKISFIAGLALVLASSVSLADESSDFQDSVSIKTTYPEKVEDSLHYLRMLDSPYKNGDISLNNNAVTEISYSPLLKNNVHSPINFEGNMAYYEGWEGDKYKPVNDGLMIGSVVYRPQNSLIKPYIGAGTGIRYIEFENPAEYNNSTYSGDILPSYQLMSGFSYTKKGKGKTSVELSLGYSYLAAFNSKTYSTDVKTEAYKTDEHSLQGKVAFKFH